MTTIKLTQKDNVSIAMQNFALSQSNNDSLETSLEAGLDQVETKLEEKQYLALLTSWKTGGLKIEVSKMKTDKNFNIIGWETILV